jgi:hypothetical protein
VHSIQCAARSTQHAEKRQKRVLKKSKGETTGKKFFPPSAFWQKVFDMYFFQKKIVVFLNSPC